MSFPNASQDGASHWHCRAIVAIENIKLNEGMPITIKCIYSITNKTKPAKNIKVK